MKSIRETAEEIVSLVPISSRERITRMIVQALRYERERAAKIAETEYVDPNWHSYFRTAGEVIARAIRKKD